MNKKIETYEEIVRYKRCLDLTKYYQLTNEELDKIYDFLEKHPDDTIIGNKESITLKPSDSNESVVIQKPITDIWVDGVRVSNKEFVVIPHFKPSNSDYSSGGSSSNNNNNNNHNNNNNNNR